MKYCNCKECYAAVGSRCYPMDKAVSRSERLLQGISQAMKFAEVRNTTVVKQEGANVT